MNDITVDEAYEIVETFERQIAGRNICNDVTAEHQEHLVHLFLSGLQGDGFTQKIAMAIADELDTLMQPHGWFVAKRACVLDPGKHHVEDPQTLCYIDVFPLRGEPQAIERDLWHVTPRSVREQILRHGLLAMTGGRDHITTPEPRLYAAIHPSVAKAVITDMERLRGWTDMDIWKISGTFARTLTWWKDVELHDLSVWTAKGVPIEYLELQTDMVG